MTSIGMRVVDLRKKFSANLLQKFYYDLLVPAFKSEQIDQLEDFDVFYDGLKADLKQQPYALHVILILDQFHNVVAGSSCEYYPKSKFGLMTYLIVTEPFRRKGLAKEMVEYTINTLNLDTSIENPKRNHGISGLFVVTKPMESLSGSQYLGQDFTLRQKILSKLGFGELEFNYLLPVNEEGEETKSDATLLAHKRFCPENSVDKYRIVKWIEEYNAMMVNDPNDADLQKMIENIPGSVKLKFYE